MKLSQTGIVIALAILVATSSGCGVINRIRAKNQLNEAAKAYREGRFPEAEQHSRRAAELDPENKTAPMTPVQVVSSSRVKWLGEFNMSRAALMGITKANCEAREFMQFARAPFAMEHAPRRAGA